MDFQCASPSNTSLYCLLYCAVVTEERTVDAIFLRRWPDIFQIDRFARRITAERFGGEVKVHAPPQERKRRPAEARPDNSREPADEWRPSKLRLPLSTATAIRLLSLIGAADGLRPGGTAVANARGAPIAEPG